MINDHRPQWDAETLAEAKTIEEDPSRLNAAKIEAGKMAKDQQKRANNMKKVSGSKLTDKTKPTRRNPQRSDTAIPVMNNHNVFKRI